MDRKFICQNCEFVTESIESADKHLDDNPGHEIR